ncbi:hypothetical protein MA16_Dca013866 [Dendrobium catenatum]|uniref:Uncharacterized protein n=1 Tax=Dendrobium catenatum TaxID=906689 RepID=A0A2I0WXR5_9ASPA|nr:hypothetical protein MA16_Dca013866 [Dendrobium catenatum]
MAGCLIPCAGCFPCLAPWVPVAGCVFLCAGCFSRALPLGFPWLLLGSCGFSSLFCCTVWGQLSYGCWPFISLNLIGLFIAVWGGIPWDFSCFLCNFPAAVCSLLAFYIP